MKTIEAKIPDVVLRQAEELAARERIPVDQIIGLAITQSVGIWSNQTYIAARSQRSSRILFSKALEQVPDVEPPDHDRLPASYDAKPDGTPRKAELP